MTAPRWWVLLLLSAVFGMHGVQCGGADSSVPMGHAAVAGASSLLGHSGLTSAGVTAVHAAAIPADEPGPSAQRAVVDPTGHSSPVGPMDHLWVICLAVLAAGLAALALVLFRVPRGPRVVLRHRAHRWLSSLAPPRPPDIYSLCVLRT